MAEVNNIKIKILFFLIVKEGKMNGIYGLHS